MEAGRPGVRLVPHREPLRVRRPEAARWQGACRPVLQGRTAGNASGRMQGRGLAGISADLVSDDIFAPGLRAETYAVRTPRPRRFAFRPRLRDRMLRGDTHDRNERKAAP